MDGDDFFRENSVGIFKWISINFFDTINDILEVEPQAKIVVFAFNGHGGRESVTEGVGWTFKFGDRSFGGFFRKRFTILKAL